MTVKYTYFCNSLKILLERQLLSNSLLTFYFNRRVNYDMVMEELVIEGIRVLGQGEGEGECEENEGNCTGGKEKSS